MRRRPLGAVLLTAALLAILPASCGPTAPAPAALVYAVPSLPATLAPLEAVDIVSRWAVEMVCDGLVDIDDRLEIVPALASRWDVSPDGLAYTFTLRFNALWHDGAPVTAHQVADTYRALLNPAVKVTVPRSDFQAIAAVEAPDDATLRLRLKSPDASLLSKLTLGITRWESGRPTDTGTGPFTVRDRLAGDRLTLAANPRYWAGAPGLARLNWQAVPETTAQVLLLRNGAVDGALVASPAEARRLAADGFAAHAVTGGNLQVSLRVTDPPFDQLAVRQALAAAVDRGAIAAGLVEGQAVLSAGDILPESWAHGADATLLQAYDPARARALLAGAGWQAGSDGILLRQGKPLAFTLITDAGDQLRREVALILRQQWRQVGADVDVQLLERNALVMERVLKGQFQAALLQSSVRADPDLSRRFHSRSVSEGQNFLGYRSPVLDGLLDRALAAGSRQERAGLYRQAQLLLAADAPQINLFYPAVFYVFRAGLTGLRPSAISPFWNVQDWGR